MAKTPTISDLNSEQYSLIKEISFSDIKPFILNIINKRSIIVNAYSIYQIIALAVMLAITALHTYKLIFVESYPGQYFYCLIAGLLFSFTFLIIIHELLHALAYYAFGKRNLRYGANIRRFIFYVHAHKQVVNLKAFTAVALAPFVIIHVLCLPLIVLFWHSPLSFFFGSVLLAHALFCAGDMAMIAYCYAQKSRHLYTYDDSEKKLARFYIKKDGISV